MASRERDHNIWKSPGGALFFKLGIPPNLRGHFLSTTGRPKVKISEPLGTYDPHEAREIRDQKLAHWKQTFRRLESGVPLLPEDIAARPSAFARKPWPPCGALPPRNRECA